jgi:hypothetical protein
MFHPGSDQPAQTNNFPSTNLEIEFVDALGG